MKTIISIVLVLFLSFGTFAQRVLTDEERITLKSSTTFAAFCVMATENQATYWGVDHDGSGDVDENGSTNRDDKIAFGKRNQWAWRVIYDGALSTDSRLPQIFIDLSKGKTFTLGAAPQNEEALLAVWTSAVYEEFAVRYMKIRSGDITNMK